MTGTAQLTSFQQKLLATLTEEQQAAVTVPVNESTIVVAGAGTGKTRTLTARVAWVATQGIKPLNHILAITFTNKAALELRNRLYRMFLGPRPERKEGTEPEREKRVAMPHAMTFHALAARILRKNPEILQEMVQNECPEDIKAEMDGGFTILDEGDSVDKIAEAITAYGLEPGDARSPARKSSRVLLDDLSHDATQNLTTEELIATYERESVTLALAQSGNRNAIELPAGDVVKWYKWRKAETNTLDYGDLIQLATRMLAGHPATRPAYEYICIDEAQDTDPTQASMLLHLTGGQVPIYAVGDPAQSLYTWRGAHAGSMRAIAQNHDCQQKTLTMNFRSAPNILAAANTVLAANPNQTRAELRAAPSNPQATPLRVIQCASEYHEAKLIAGHVAELIQRNVPPKEIGILARAAYVLNSVDEELTRLGIPIRITAGRKFAQRKEIMDLVAWLKVLINPADDGACARALTSPKKGLGESGLTLLRNTARRNNWNLLAVCEQAQRNGGLTDGRRKLAPSGLAAIDEVMKGLMRLMELRNSGKTADVILREAVTVSGVDKELTKKAESGDADKVTQAEAQRRRIDQLAEMGAEHGTISRLHDHLTVNETQADTGKDGRVTLSTVHSAKGLEWRHVWIMAFETDILPSAESKSAGELAEERRILHVALTRAQEQATLSWAERRKNWEGALSPFAETLGENIEYRKMMG